MPLDLLVFKHVAQLFHKNLMFLFPPALPCPGPSGWTLVEFNGHINCYYLEDRKMHFKDAEANCVEQGAHLASIHSQEENDFIWGKIYSAKLMFLARKETIKQCFPTVYH